jgi:peptidoglycan-associated lipoprotein
MRIPRLPFLAVATVTAAVGCSHKQEVATARPTRPAAPVAAPKPATPEPGELRQVASDESKNKEGDAIYFDFDSSILRTDARPVLQEVAESARKKDSKLRIEGNCDEVGTTEYNLALGDQRAHAAKEYLVHMGVPSNHITTVSYGSERPKDPGHDETAHAKNRRDDFVMQ